MLFGDISSFEMHFDFEISRVDCLTDKQPYVGLDEHNVHFQFIAFTLL